MTNARLKLMVSVFSQRMANGETFDEIAKNYPKLSSEDLEQIRKALA